MFNYWYEKVSNHYDFDQNRQYSNFEAGLLKKNLTMSF